MLSHHGFYEVVGFKEQGTALAVNQLFTYTLLQQIPVKVYVGRYNEREIEFIQNRFIPRAKVMFSNLWDFKENETAYTSLIIKIDTPLPEFLLIPRHHVGNAISANPKQLVASKLGENFKKRYFLDAEPAAILALPKPFLDFVARHNSLLLIESKKLANKHYALSICKVREELHNDFTIRNMLARANIILDFSE